jgi:hypothetical protein
MCFSVAKSSLIAIPESTLLIQYSESRAMHAHRTSVAEILLAHEIAVARATDARERDVPLRSNIPASA